jgi:tetratricopeptide (TPR) repeat protein
MEEIKKLTALRDEARARSNRLRAAAGSAGAGELAPWLLCESARGFLDARLPADAREEAAAVLDKFPESRFRPAAALILARACAQLSRPADAAAACRQALSCKGASRAERGEAWKALAEILDNGGKPEELRALLVEQISRGPEEPGVGEAVERLIAVSLSGPKDAAAAGQRLAAIVESWPAGAVRPEWVSTAGKIAEFVDRDYARAEKLYRLVLERYPEAAFDLESLKSGGRKADAGREVILAAGARAGEPRAAGAKPPAGPPAESRGKTPEKALATVLGALRSGDVETARSGSSGALSADVAGGRCDFARFGLSDFRILGARQEAAGVEVDYEVSGELGVTRVLKKKAKAVQEGGAWKITDLGL